MVTSWALCIYESLIVATDIISSCTHNNAIQKKIIGIQKRVNIYILLLFHNRDVCYVCYTGSVTLSFKKSIASNTEHEMWMNVTNEARGMRKIFGLWRGKALGNGENNTHSSFMSLLG
jgi:hypothetical protein